MTAVNEYAASEMRYWCRTWDYGGVGYSQPNRWSAYDASDWQGWLKGPGEMDCSAGVAGAYNIAFHECLGEGVRPALFPPFDVDGVPQAGGAGARLRGHWRLLDGQHSGRGLRCG